MKTTIKGNYSFRKPSKQKISKVPAVIGLILIFLSFVAGTQYFAWNVGQNRLPNEILSYAGIKIYFPTEILEWLKLWKKSHRDMKDFTDSLIVMGGCAFMGVASKTSASAAPAEAIMRLWNAPATFRGRARLTPCSFRAPHAFSTRSFMPLITIWPGEL